MTSTEPRVRLTREQQRDQTRTRLLEAARDLFAAHGIGATSVGDIAEAAGYSRGAFYSNFADREELVFTLLELHQATSMGDVETMLQDADTAEDFLLAMLDRERSQAAERSRLSMEYILFATRTAAGRQQLADLNTAMLSRMESLVRGHFALAGDEPPIDVEQAAKIVFALDEGFALLRLIDAESYPSGIWGESILFLNDAITALINQRSGQ